MQENSLKQTQEDSKSTKEQQDYFLSPMLLKNQSSVSKGHWVKFPKIKSDDTPR